MVLFLKTFFLCGSFFFPFLLFSKIIEVDSISELEKYAEPKNLIVFDIDNTLIEPTQVLGSDQWFQNRVDEYIKAGMDKEGAIETTLPEWMAVQSITKVKLVEDHADQIVEKFQKQGFTVMGLTTRGLGLSTRTVEQLKLMNIDMLYSAPVHHDVFFHNLRGCLFRRGILFTAATHKGRALFRLLERIDYHPKSILFINDKYANLREVEETCEQRGIPFLGLRYSYLDNKVKNFRKDLADVQLEHFGNILSDRDAEKILKGRKKKSHD